MGGTALKGKSAIERCKGSSQAIEIPVGKLEMQSLVD